MVRLIQGHEGEHFPQKREEEIQSIVSQVQSGRFQLAHPGSYAFVEDFSLREVEQDAKGIDVSVYFQPHLPRSGHTQTIVSTLDDTTKTGFAIILTESGAVEVRVGTGSHVEAIETCFETTRREWVEARVSIHAKDALVDIELIPLAAFAQQPSQAPFVLKNYRCGAPTKLFGIEWLLFAASYSQTPAVPSPCAVDFFNGKIANPKIVATMMDGKGRTMAEYDFSVGMQSDNIFDQSNAAAHGRLVNAPTRAVTDHDWDGTEVDWTKAEYGYGAMHFHEDDLDNADWDTDFRFQIPRSARSGAYAVKAEATNGLAKDDITFFVRPSAETAANVGAKVALVLSTFTYLAYGNERMYDQSKPSRMEAPDPAFAIRKDSQFYRMERRADLGLSTYDVHKDESGVVFSSPRRPLLAVRPDHINWAMWRPREFSADLMMIGFLEHLGVPYDVITDHDLHFCRQEASSFDIKRYRVLITGCHPEYPTLESLEAYTEFASLGGSIMYLGGNGFYWVAAMRRMMDSGSLDAFQGRLEVRRGDQGVRSHTLPGGELYFSTNGHRGALWRSRGRSPNVLFGIGSTGEGTGPGVPYHRSEASKSRKYRWMFEGIDADVIGIDGFGGGASGDEIDKYDVRNGSPIDAVVLATTTGHSDEFGLFPEEAGFPMKDTCGSQTREIRSDMVYYETSGYGHVFSVGSINWFCSLGWEDFDNDIAKLTSNVLHRFLEKSN